MRLRAAVIFALLVVPQMAGAGRLIVQGARNDREHLLLLRLVSSGEPPGRCIRATIGP